MNLRYTAISAMCALCLCAGAQSINPITQAMLDGYETLLAQNPKDYLTLYERASQYYRLDRYDEALSDIKKAISYTPAKDKEQLGSEYSLLCDIYTQLGEYDNALIAIDNAINNSSQTYPLLYTKGNICLHLNKTTEAKDAYSAMQRINPRSSESLFGLAHVYALEGNSTSALKYLEDAEKADPTNYLTYCRLGDIHRELGMPQHAAADYLSAFSLSSTTDRPLSSILDLARENYDAVDDAIDYAASKTSNVVPLYFIHANVATEGGKYQEAYNSYRQLISAIPEQDAENIYYPLAYVALHMGNIGEADSYVSKAMAARPDMKTNMLKADIELAKGNIEAARMYSNAALRLEATDARVLNQAAYIECAAGNYAEATRYLTDVILNDATNIDALIMRGYINANKLKNQASALSDFSRAALVEGTDHEAVAKKAIAQLKAGRSLDATSTIGSVRQAASTDAKASYYLALFDLAADDAVAAKVDLEAARDKGFEDEYLLNFYSAPLLSVAPLRK